MNLNKQQQQKWHMISSIFQAISAIATDEVAVMTAMKDHVDAFETMLDGKARIKIRFSPAKTIEWVDCSRDSLKVTKDATGLTMRARVEGISIMSVVSYKDAYSHTNMALAEALEELAAGLRTLKSDIKEIGESTDLSSLIGIQASAENGDDENETGENTAVAATTAATEQAQAKEAVDPEDAALISLFAPTDSVGEAPAA